MYIENIPEYNGAGIYMLKGINNKLVYVGSSIHIAKRILEHQHAIEHNGGSSNRMRLMIKSDYKFEAIVLERISNSHTTYYLKHRENYYVKKFNACGENGLNSVPVGGYKNNCLFALQKDLSNLKFAIDHLEKAINNYTTNNSAYKERLILYADSTVRSILESMMKKMKQMDNDQ